MAFAPYALGAFILLAYTLEAITGFGSIVIALSLGALLLPIDQLLPVLVPLNIGMTGYLVSRHWRLIDRRLLLGTILPGMLTGAILGLSRVAGETAAIMFTASVFFTPYLPTNITDSVMALPYHIYVLATAGTDIDKTRPLQYGTGLVLLLLVLRVRCPPPCIHAS